jgi:RimJ/RimL family protein N-acetyltransferase
MAFIAVDEQSQKMLGVVRLHDDTSGETAEFAILVRSRLKEHGVGWLLMKHMIEFSKHKDLKIVRGQVLSENTTMLAMCAELGFHIADDPDDPGVKTVTLPVRTAHLDANFG